jgi:hypothetical protein
MLRIFELVVRVSSGSGSRFSNSWKNEFEIVRESTVDDLTVRILWLKSFVGVAALTVPRTLERRELSFPT